MNPAITPAAGERGSAAAELALITPALAAMLLLVVAGGRLAVSRGEVAAAARDAARAATIARDPHTAQAAARHAAQAALTGRFAPCQPLDVTVDTADFRPSGSVTVSVTCHVPLADLTLLSLPATHPVTGQATAVVDRYRGASDPTALPTTR